MKRKTTKTNSNVTNRRHECGSLIVTDRESLNCCWVKTGNQYELVGKKGKTHNRSLPRNHEPTKKYTMCEYWNPDIYEEEEKRLSLFVDISEEGILYVPEEIAGMIIGKGGKNKKAWEEKLGVKYSSVQPVKCETVEKAAVV